MKYPLRDRRHRSAGRQWQWPTLSVAAMCHLSWWGCVVVAPSLIGKPLTVLSLSVVLTLYSSLQHEVLHGHPFRSRLLSESLVWPAYGLFIPYQRFRSLHLAHHHDPQLTDPYDDPESQYLDPVIWYRLPRACQALLRINNTLAGRMVVGPLLGLAVFLGGELRLLLRSGECRRAWRGHVLALLPVLAVLLALSSLSLSAYLLAVYFSLSLLRIRTFLEHQAHPLTPARTVVIDSRGPLAWLFLFNNFHAVHHAHPRLPWYRLPGHFARHRDTVLARNRDYRYRSYADVAWQYLFKAKDPVAHPLWSSAAVHRPAPDPSSAASMDR